MRIFHLVDFPRYYLKEDSGPQANYSTHGPRVTTILKPKPYEGFTVIAALSVSVTRYSSNCLLGTNLFKNRRLQ